MKVRSNGVVNYVRKNQLMQPPAPPVPPDDDDSAQDNTLPAPPPPDDNDSVFSSTDDADFHDLYNGRQYYQKQNFDIDTQMALDDYLSDKALPGTVYSASQTLNHKMKQGLPLTANEQFMVDSMMNGMHNLGYNLNLTRYARVDFMQRLGAGNFDSMTPAQLQSALVGKGFTEGSFISTSYNDFKNAPSGNVFTDKAVRINYKAPANTQALMPGNGPGGQLGEMVLAPNQHYTITGARFTGKTGRSGSSYYKQVEIDITIG